MISDTKILDSINLIEIKTSILGIKETLLIIIKDLKENDISALKELCQNAVTPLIFENFFEIARIYKQLDAANNMPFVQRENAFFGIVKGLIECNHLDRALEIANELKDEGNKNYALQLVGCKLCQNGNPDRALIVGSAISIQLNKDNVLLEIVKAFIEKGELGKATEAF